MDYLHVTTVCGEPFLELKSDLPTKIMKEASMNLVTHLLLAQDSSSVKYTGMLLRGGLSSAKQTEPLLTVME